MRSYDALEVAKYVVDKCTKDGKPVSNLQLQKMLYYLQGNFFRKKGCFLFRDDIEAWQYGPVVPKVYYKFYPNGGSPISMFFNTNIDPDDKLTIDNYIEKLREVDTWELVDRSHSEGTPWQMIYRGFHEIIPKKVLEKYFSSIGDRNAK